MCNNKIFNKYGNFFNLLNLSLHKKVDNSVEKLINPPFKGEKLSTELLN